MPDDAMRKAASEAVRAAQRKFESDNKVARKARREAFAQARAAGLSLREIAKEVGLHYSRVSEILNGK
jgi:hypothetical protein